MQTDTFSEVKSRQREEFNGSSLKNFRYNPEKTEELKLNESLQRCKMEVPPEVSKQTTFGTILDGNLQPVESHDFVADRKMNRVSLGLGL